MKRSALGCAALLWLAAAPAALAEPLLDGALGNWLDEVAGALGETLSRHPRFSGETIRLVALTPGDSSGRSNRLAQAVERRLRERLLAYDGVRLAADGPRRDCEPPPSIGYLVRVEVAEAGRRDARVHVAVVDVAEAVWVSGISDRWNGSLTAAERRALAEPVNQASPGSAGSPIPLEDAAAVAAAMKADLACTLPRNLDGSLYVAAPAASPLARVTLALQAALVYEPLAAVTPDRDEASWLLSLDAEAAGADVRELNLTLADAQGGRRQRVASVFVSGMPSADPPPPAVSPGRPTPAEPDPGVARGTALPPPVARRPELLSALEMRPARPEGICDDRRARINSCVEIEFELRERAYLWVLSTRDHAVVEADCDARPERREAGTRRYRLRVPPGAFAVDPEDTGPDAGLYVIAVRERDVAQRLQDVLAAAPGACRGAAGERRWLDDLARVLDEHRSHVSWRALHVVHDTAGIAAL